MRKLRPEPGVFRWIHGDKLLGLFNMYNGRIVIVLNVSDLRRLPGAIFRLPGSGLRFRGRVAFGRGCVASKDDRLQRARTVDEIHRGLLCLLDVADIFGGDFTRFPPGEELLRPVFRPDLEFHCLHIR